MLKINNGWRAIVILEHAALVVALLLGASFAAGYRYADTPAAAADAEGPQTVGQFDLTGWALACTNIPGGRDNLLIRAEVGTQADVIGAVPPGADGVFYVLWESFTVDNAGNSWVRATYQADNAQPVQGWAMHHKRNQTAPYVIGAQETLCSQDLRILDASGVG